MTQENGDATFFLVYYSVMFHKFYAIIFVIPVKMGIQILVFTGFLLPQE